MPVRGLISRQSRSSCWPPVAADLRRLRRLPNKLKPARGDAMIGLDDQIRTVHLAMRAPTRLARK
jgi:hypothetical protein